jgi:peptidoglycan/LPS O-acetylase OafA/YrhL
VLSSNNSWPARYFIIDASRGIAALGVVCYHLGVGHRFNLGHACVMVFFVISGYCITATSVSCQKSHTGFRTFMWRRIRRIFPPYWLALLFFVGTRLLKASLGSGQQLSSSLTAWLQTASLTQWVGLVHSPISFAAENPRLFVAAFWSLNYEEQFYLLMAAMIVIAGFRRSLLISVVPFTIVSFIANLAYPSTSFGLFVDYWFHFSLGVLVYYRLCGGLRLLACRVIDALFISLMLLSILKWPAHLNIAGTRSVYFEWLVAAGFAISLVVARRWDVRFKESLIGSGLCSFGLITYSLYLTHQFNLHIAGAVADKLRMAGLPSAIQFPAEIAVLVSIAIVFWFFCERPFINRPLRKEGLASNRIHLPTVSSNPEPALDIAGQ